MSERDVATGREGAGGEDLQVLCKVDAAGHGLDVEWTSGAVFHFDGEGDLREWIDRQDRQVPGTFYLRSDVPGDDVLSPDYYLTYRPPTGE